MAKVLQCTSCGATTRIDSLTDGATFECETCGQVMKVPPGLAARSSGSRTPAPAPTGAPSASPSPSPSEAPAPTVAPAAAPPAPRRRSRSTAPAAGAVAASAAAAGGGTAVLAPGDAAASVPPPAPAPASRSARRATRAGGAARDDHGEALPLWMRVLIWIVALPLGLAIVGIPARQLGYLTSQKLLDVIVKTDLSRFVPIFVIIVLWALVTAGLVTLFNAGGRRLLSRRRERAAEQRQMSALDMSPSGGRGLLGRRKK